MAASVELTNTLLDVARGIDPSADILDVRVDGDGFGLVLWKRTYTIGDLLIPEFIVHRWGTKDTAGQDIKPMFYSGGYYDDLQAAGRDLRERHAEPGRTVRA